MALHNQWTPGRGQNIKPKSFPANPEDIEKFKTDIATMLYSKQQLPHIVEMLKKGAQALPQVIGHIAANTVVSLLMRRAKEGGTKVHIKLLFFGLKDAIMILNKIAAKAGVGEMDPQGIQEAVKIAGEVSAKMLEKKNPQQSQGAPAPQAAPMQGGAPQVPQQPVQQTPMQSIQPNPQQVM